MTIGHAGTGTRVAATTGATTPALSGTAAAGDLLVSYATARYSNATLTTPPSGFTLQTPANNPGGTGADAVGTGTTDCWICTKEAAGGETGTLSISVSSNNYQAHYARFTKAAGTTWDVLGAGGADTTLDTAYSAASSATLDLQPGDVILVTSVVNDDAPAFSAQALSAPGITFSGGTVDTPDAGSTSGSDQRAGVYRATVASGSGTVTVTFTQTLSVAAAGSTAFLRIREVAAGSTTPSASDTATQAEGTSAVALSTSDPATQAEGTSAVALSTSDPAALSEAASVDSPDKSATDTGTLTEDWTTVEGVTAGADATLTEGAASITAAVAATDLGTLGEVSSLDTGAVPISGADTATLTEADRTVDVIDTDPDGTLTETAATIVAAVGAADTATQAEGTPAVLLAGADAATQGEGTSAVDLASTDTATQGEGTSAVDLAAADAGTQVEGASAVALASTDADTLTEASAATAAVAAVDTATHSEGSTVSAEGNPAAADTATQAEGASAITATAATTEAGAFAEAAPDVQLAAVDQAAGAVEAAGALAAAVGAADTATQAEGTTAGQASPSSADTWSLTEQATAQAAGGAVDTWSLAETVAVAAQVVATDPAALSETSVAGIPVAGVDTATQAEAPAAVAAAGQAVDTWSLAETAGLVVAGAGADTAGLAEAGSVVVVLSGADLAMVADVPAVAALLASSDLAGLLLDLSAGVIEGVDRPGRPIPRDRAALAVAGTRTGGALAGDQRSTVEVGQR